MGIGLVKNLLQQSPKFLLCGTQPNPEQFPEKIDKLNKKEVVHCLSVCKLTCNSYTHALKYTPMNPLYLVIVSHHFGKYLGKRFV